MYDQDYKPNTKVDTALQFLNNLIELGVEYPEAHYRATAWHTLSAKQADTLQQMYDNQSEGV